MKVIVNAKPIECEDNMTLLALLKQLSLEDKVMAAAVNMTIVKQDKWQSHELQNEDKLELLDFVGGG